MNGFTVQPGLWQVAAPHYHAQPQQTCQMNYGLGSGLGDVSLFALAVSVVK